LIPLFALWGNLIFFSAYRVESGFVLRNIRLLIEYEGTGYVGWQCQPNGPSIQGIMEGALCLMTGEEVSLKASGRTDAGVHSQGQTANFHTGKDIPLKGFVHGLNSLLPRDISVRRADLVGETFDSRRCALGKTYLYTIQNSQAPSALRNRFSWHVRKPLDDKAMAEAAGYLVGAHDFEAFRSTGCDAPHAFREITSLTVKRVGEVIEIEVTGSGFLRHMVRIISGTLVEAGLRRIPPSAIVGIIESRDRKRAGDTAPPQGLVLKEVYYDEPVLETYP
jgi:tRNA pseudouridine38-40 synthase